MSLEIEIKIMIERLTFTSPVVFFHPVPASCPSLLEFLPYSILPTSQHLRNILQITISVRLPRALKILPTAIIWIERILIYIIDNPTNDSSTWPRVIVRPFLYILQMLESHFFREALVQEHGDRRRVIQSFIIWSQDFDDWDCGFETRHVWE